MAQHEPVARIEALYRNEWPGSAKNGRFVVDGVSARLWVER